MLARPVSTAAPDQILVSLDPTASVPKARSAAFATNERPTPLSRTCCSARARASELMSSAQRPNGGGGVSTDGDHGDATTGEPASGARGATQHQTRQTLRTTRQRA